MIEIIFTELNLPSYTNKYSTKYTILYIFYLIQQKKIKVTVMLEENMFGCNIYQFLKQMLIEAELYGF